MEPTPERLTEIRVLNLMRSPTFYAENRGLVKVKHLAAECVPIYKAIELLHSKANDKLVGTDYSKNLIAFSDIVSIVKRRRSVKEMAIIKGVLDAMGTHAKDFENSGRVKILYTEYRDSILIREVLLAASMQQEQGVYDVAKLQELMTAAAQSEPVSQIVAEPADFPSLLSRLKVNRLNRIGTGFVELDEALQGGLGVGELAVIGGYGKSGKSAVLMSIALTEMRDHHRPVLYITMADLHALELEMRLACMIANCKEEDLKPGDMDEITRWQKRRSNYFIPVDLTGRTIAPGQIEALIASVKDKYPQLRLVIIDRAESMARVGNQDQIRHRIAKVFTDLRGIAENTQVAIYVDIQTDVRSKYKTRVHWSDAHESKVDVGATLDIWIGIGRKMADPSVRFFHLAGRRRIKDDLHRYRFNENFTFTYELMYEGEEDDGTSGSGVEQQRS